MSTTDQLEVTVNEIAGATSAVQKLLLQFVPKMDQRITQNEQLIVHHTQEMERLNRRLDKVMRCLPQNGADA